MTLEERITRLEDIKNGFDLLTKGVAGGTCLIAGGNAANAAGVGGGGSYGCP